MRAMRRHAVGSWRCTLQRGRSKVAKRLVLVGSSHTWHVACEELAKRQKRHEASQVERGEPHSPSWRGAYGWGLLRIAPQW